ncbi:MAG: hypothetical protein AMXMBFR84_44930 [Candidatus Hydrogenedentota bacterium]
MAVVLIVLAALAADYWLIEEQVEPITQSEPVPTTDMPPLLPEVPAESGGATLWSTYHGSTSLSGVVSTPISDAPAVRWQVLVEGPVFQAPVADENGIYVVSRSGVVTALDYEGNEQWTRQLVRKDSTEPERIDAPMACFESTLFAGSISGIVHAINTASGEVMWTYDVGGDILGTVNFQPPVENEPARLYVIERSEGVLHCIRFDGSGLLWKTDPIARCDGSAAVAGGIVAFGSCASAFHAYAALDGRKLAYIELGEDAQVAGGLALVGANMFGGCRNGQVFRADIETGKVVWSTPITGKEAFTTPAVGEELVVYGSEDGLIHAVEKASGQPKWKFETKGVPSSAVLAGDKVLAGSSGVLYLLKLDSGEIIWDYEVSDQISPPSLVGDMIVVGSEDGTIVAFNAAPQEDGKA